MMKTGQQTLAQTLEQMDDGWIVLIIGIIIIILIVIKMTSETPEVRSDKRRTAATAAADF